MKLTSCIRQLLCALIFWSLGSACPWRAAIAASDDVQFELKQFAIVATFEKLNDRMSYRDLQRFAAAQQAKLPRRVTYDDLQVVTKSVTQFMRSKGFKFHYAYLPTQDIKDGVVSISVRTVSLSDIDITNESPIKDSILYDQFEHLLNKPLYQPEVDKIMLNLRAFPEIKVFAFYSRGTQVDSVRLNVKLAKVKSGRVQIKVDNHGSEETGKTRTFLQGQWLSPTGRLDRLSGGILASPGETQVNTYGYLTYSTPLFGIHDRMTLSASNNVFNLGEDFAALELNGDAKVYRLSVDRNFARSRNGVQRIQLIAESKETEFESGTTANVSEAYGIKDESSKSGGINWQWNGNISNSLFQYVSLGYYFGTFSNPNSSSPISSNPNSSNTSSAETRDTDFTKISYSYYFGWNTSPGSNSRLSSRFSLSLRGQATGEQLGQSDKISLGGASATRSAQPGSFAADKGNVTTLEWRLPKLINKNAESWRFEPYLFTDYATGDLLDETGNVVNSAQLWGSGLGIDVSLYRNFFLKAEVATSHKVPEGSSAIEGEQNFLTSLEYRWP